jgi:hypothetical protein
MNTNTKDSIARNRGVQNDNDEDLERQCQHVVAGSGELRRHSPADIARERLADDEACRNLAKTLQTLIRNNNELQGENARLRLDIGSVQQAFTRSQSSQESHNDIPSAIWPVETDDASYTSSTGIIRQQSGSLSDGGLQEVQYSASLSVDSADQVSGDPSTQDRADEFIEE